LGRVAAGQGPARGTTGLGISGRSRRSAEGRILFDWSSHVPLSTYELKPTQLRIPTFRYSHKNMAKADRLERLDAHRSELEAEYTAAFMEALRITASGKWGLFGHNSDRWTRAAAAPIIANLAEIGEAIDQIRDQLMMAPFELQQQFLAARGPVAPQALGEPKQAQAWLDQLAADISER